MLEAGEAFGCCEECLLECSGSAPRLAEFLVELCCQFLCCAESVLESLSLFFGLLECLFCLPEFDLEWVGVGGEFLVLCLHCADELFLLSVLVPDFLLSLLELCGCLLEGLCFFLELLGFFCGLFDPGLERLESLGRVLDFVVEEGGESVVVEGCASELCKSLLEAEFLCPEVGDTPSRSDDPADRLEEVVAWSEEVIKRGADEGGVGEEIHGG